MNKTFYRSGFALLAIGALAGSDALRPNDLIRQGNAAFASGDFDQAGARYAVAEGRTTDPGLVAFNQGAALYQLGAFREAELQWRRCREDALGARRMRLLYNLGNCLVQEGRGQDLRRLKEAIGFYEECLQHQQDDPGLVADARHNLELARLLLVQARSRKEGSTSANEETDAETPQPEVKHEDYTGSDDGGPQGPGARGRPQRGAESGRDPKAAASRAAHQPSAGKGDLPPLPDEEELTPLDPEDTAAYLQQAAARIAGERRSYRQRAVPPAPPNVKDW